MTLYYQDNNFVQIHGNSNFVGEKHEEAQNTARIEHEPAIEVRKEDRRVTQENHEDTTDLEAYVSHYQTCNPKTVSQDWPLEGSLVSYNARD